MPVAKEATTNPVLPVVKPAAPAPPAAAKAAHVPPAPAAASPSAGTPVAQAPAAPAAAETGAASTEDPTQSAGRAQDIQRLIMEGDVRMAVSDYANASKVYGALVDLAPNVPAYRLRLAIAMACWPRLAKQAEREFLEAARLDPNNADLHYQFGLYYKSMKVKSRLCSPSPKITGASPRSMRVMKRGITAAYWEAGSWAGPKTLK